MRRYKARLVGGFETATYGTSRTPGGRSTHRRAPLHCAFAAAHASWPQKTSKIGRDEKHPHMQQSRQLTSCFMHSCRRMTGYDARANKLPMPPRASTARLFNLSVNARRRRLTHAPSSFLRFLPPLLSSACRPSRNTHTVISKKYPSLITRASLIQTMYFAMSDPAFHCPLAIKPPSLPRRTSAFPVNQCSAPPP